VSYPVHGEKGFPRERSRRFYPLMIPHVLNPPMRSQRSIDRAARTRGEYAWLFYAGLAILLQSCAEMPRMQTALHAPDENQTGGGSGSVRGLSGLQVLMIGDSLTVGDFGTDMQEYLLRRFGNGKVAVYASCGSSPEHWMRSAPKYITRCGYREETPGSSVLYDFEHGRRPQQVLTPRIEDLVEKFRPRSVIVQLGTNWMDGMGPNSRSDQFTYGAILDRFVAAIHSQPNTVRTIIWITPPDSTRYPKSVERRVNSLITAAAERDSFRTIDSRNMTHYIRGKSGSDGVHYNRPAAKEWADRVISELDQMLR